MNKIDKLLVTIKLNFKSVSILYWISFTLLFLFISLLMYLFSIMQIKDDYFLQIFDYKIYWDDSDENFRNSLFFTKSSKNESINPGDEILYFHPENNNKIMLSYIDSIEYNKDSDESIFSLNLDNGLSVDNSLFVGKITYESKFLYKILKFVINPVNSLFFIILPILILIIFIFFLSLDFSVSNFYFYKKNKKEKYKIKSSLNESVIIKADKNTELDSKLKLLIGISQNIHVDNPNKEDSILNNTDSTG